MALWQKLASIIARPRKPAHLEIGALGERAAKKHLKAQGLKFLTANFISKHGEIDLIFRDGNGLVFVEVKTRSGNPQDRPARAVDKSKQRLISKSALEYLRLIKTPQIPFRFDIVEVLVENSQIKELRHLKGTFTLSGPFRYGTLAR
jgi:putative endonuclease